MIFKPELVELIINQRKTQTRRKAKPDTPCAYKPGKHYAVQPGRGQKAVERIWITDVRQDTVGEIGHQDSLREGFENIGAFIEYWEALYQREMDYDQPVWVISFELYRGQDKVPKPPRDVVRSLRVAMDPGQPASEGFAERRRAPEPEPVDPAIVEKLPARLEAQQRWIKDRTHREAAYHQGSVTERLDRALADARANRIDTSSIERLIARKVTELERRNQRAA